MRIKHLAAKLEGCQRDLINDKRLVLIVLDRISQVLKLRVLKRVLHEFSPHGISAVYLLAESHIAFHSFPEIGLVDLEIVSCSSSSDVLKGLEIAIRGFKPRKVRKRVWEYPC
jgi:S-adenosylmethionine decarboxylase